MFNWIVLVNFVVAFKLIPFKRIYCYVLIIGLIISRYSLEYKVVDIIISKANPTVRMAELQCYRCLITWLDLRKTLNSGMLVVVHLYERILKKQGLMVQTGLNWLDVTCVLHALPISTCVATTLRATRAVKLGAPGCGFVLLLVPARYWLWIYVTQMFISTAGLH
jgi:hypothetical protein